MATTPIDQTRTRYQENVEVVDVYKSNFFPAVRWGDVSIGAILGGVLIALIVHLAMNMLGLSIGANTINPATEANPVEAGLVTATVVWMAFSALVALLAGGWVAGRLSNTSNPVNSTLHGVVAWALTWIIMLAFIGSTVGSLISGLGGMVSQGVSMAATTVVSVAPAVADNLSIEGQTLGAFAGEFSTLLNANQTNTADTATSNTTGTDSTQMQNPTVAQPMTMADLSLSRDVTSFVTNTNLDEAQRQSLATQLAERTSLTEPEAVAQLEMWRNGYQEVRAQAEETARNVGQATADTVAAVSGSLFGILLVSMFAAALGAYAGGTRRHETALQAATS